MNPYHMNPAWSREWPLLPFYTLRVHSICGMELVVSICDFYAETHVRCRLLFLRSDLNLGEIDPDRLSMPVMLTLRSAQRIVHT